jgi:transposase
VHLVMDNYWTHKTPKVHRWLLRHPRFQVHFTPTSASWLNQVERFFAAITTQRIRRGTFDSVAALERALHEYLDHTTTARRRSSGRRRPTRSFRRSLAFVNELLRHDTSVP